MNINSEKQRLTSLLSLKSAPQGKIDGDFRVALYAVAALYQLDFSKSSNFGLCASLLGSVGFKGDMVAQRQIIGTIGNTGITTGPHLHYEVHIGSDVVDPAKYINEK